MSEEEKLALAFTPCLEKCFKRHSETFGLTKYLVLTALFDPIDTRRMSAINQLQSAYDDKIKNIIVGDNQIFLHIIKRDGFDELFYLCEKPRHYSGMPIEMIYQFPDENPEFRSYD